MVCCLAVVVVESGYLSLKMEEPLSDEAAKKSPTSEKQRQQSSVSSMQIPMKVSKTTKPTISANSHLLTPIGSIRKRTEPKNSSDSSSNVTAKNASSCNTKSVPIARRNSTGGVPEKQPVSSTKRQNTSGKTNAVSDPVRRSLPELRRSSLPPTKPMVRTGSVSETRNSVPMDKFLRASTGSGVSRLEKPSVKPALPASSSSSSSSRRVISTSADSTASSMSRKKLSSPSARSPSISSGLRAGSLSTSRDRSFNLTGRRRAGAPESHDSHFIALPLVETKAGDDVVSMLFICSPKTRGMLFFLDVLV